jgi:hypothetical protein
MPPCHPRRWGCKGRVGLHDTLGNLRTSQGQFHDSAAYAEKSGATIAAFKVLATGQETHPGFSTAAAEYLHLFAPGADGSMTRHISCSLLFLSWQFIGEHC